MKQLFIVMMLLAVLFMGLALLISNYIDGVAFVAFLIAGFVGTSVYGLLPYIAEFSIGGNSVKFQEKLNEAERITEELRKLKRISVKTTLKTLKAPQDNNFTLYHNLKEFREVYLMLSGTADFDENNRSLVTETAMAIRENVFDFVELSVEAPVPHWYDWRDESIGEYLRSIETKTSISSKEKMSILFARQYLHLTAFIDGLNQQRTPALSLVTPGEGWHVIMRDQAGKIPGNCSAG